MLRVLVVDDCSDSALALQYLLQSWGHSTRVAGDGAAALAMAGDFKPEVVILDIGLPVMDGYEVANRLRRCGQQKPVLIAHSGYCSDADIRRSLEAGCIAHLSKPVDPEEIRRTLGICEKWLHWNPSV